MRNCYQVKLGFICPFTAMPVYSQQVVVKKSAVFIIAGCQSKASRWMVLKSPELWKAFREKFLKTGWGKGCRACDQLMDVLLIGWWWEVTRSQHHQPSGSSRSGGYMPVGNTQLNSSTWWGFQYPENSSENMAQNIIYSPWRGTKGPWLCLMAKLLYFVLLDCFSFFQHFLTSLVKFTLWNSAKA